MKNYILLAILIAILFPCCQQSSKDKGTLQSKDLKRIVLVGGSLISSMENYGFFEMAVTRNFSDEDISFRNIGWPGDDVYGLARSQFGSAQNTRSWQPPSSEKGFGSKVLMQHIEDTEPTTLIIGYGGEAAFAENEDDFEVFTSGYKRLLDFAELKSIPLILLSPHKHEASFLSLEELNQSNEWLSKATAFIEDLANTRKHMFIDLFNTLISDTGHKTYTENGVQLNEGGYERMNEILLENLGITHTTEFSISLDDEAKIINCGGCRTSDWSKTVNGISFNLKPSAALYSGKVISKEPVAIFINGKLQEKTNDAISWITLHDASLKAQRLLETIKEKNRLHRYQLRPLNEAYIYLFRRHEMDHLAYEMDDLARLVEEKEREIKRLLPSQTFDVEIELVRPWQPPKDYPEDEVPAFIPEPDIAAELGAFHIANGFEINLFAADPMIANPININWDSKGRMWVATSSIYPHIVPGREPNDRIVILEDTDGDGQADKHTVFAENLLVPHSVMPVFGGAYVTATTELLFLADRDGDDFADERRVVFDGFGNADIHHTIHGLRWSPWGDLHFTQSIYINSFVETAYGLRKLNGSGIWKFRPETEKLDVYCRGLVNPWGETFDEWGQTFATDGAGSSGMNYVFPESAHRSAVGASKILDGLNSGKPKNTSAEVVYSRHFPQDWQGTIITNDFRANRTVRYKVTPHQSGYRSKEVELILRSDHRSYRPIDNKIGPDGALYIVDWYNPIINHGEVDFHHPIRDKTHGRIWKLTKKDKPLLQAEPFHESSHAQLLNLLKSPEQFTRLQANRAFVEQNGDPQMVINWIKSIRPSEPNSERHRLEGLWLLAALNHFDEQSLLNSLGSFHPQERAAAVRLLSHWQKQTDYLKILDNLTDDIHPQVRLEAIHALREMGGLAAAETAVKVLDHPMDQNLEFAIWLTINKLQKEWLPAFASRQVVFGGDVNKQMYALLTSNDPQVIPHITNLLNNPDLENSLANDGWLQLAKIGDAVARSKVLEKAASEGNSLLLSAMVNASEANDAVASNLALLEPLISHEDINIKRESLKLAGRWKAQQFEALVTDRLSDSSSQQEKLAALRALRSMGKLNKVVEMTRSPHDLSTRTTAYTVWIEEAPAKAANDAVDFLSSLESTELAELIFNTFRRLEEGPEILRKALAGKKIPEDIASVGLKVVHTSGLPLGDLDQALRKAGSIKAIGTQMSKEDKEQLIKDAVENGNVRRGQKIYRRPELLCGSCHRTERVGGLSGPDLSTIGSFMTPNSILESMLNPNSDIKQNYETILVTKTNGEVVSGLLHRKTDNSTLIRMANSELVEIPSGEIEQVDVSPVSLMPIGLTRNLHRDELKDLLAYLMSLGAEY